MNNIPWRLVHSFLKVSEVGSLSSAAKVLGLSQPTISRDVQRLESQIGVQLFKRTTKGLMLTDQGASLIHTARVMEQSANQFERKALGLSDNIKGDLRISANETVAYHTLPKLINEFRNHYPHVAIDLVVDNKESNLNSRDADIAFRMFRPQQADLFTRRLKDIPLGLYASRDYIQQHSAPISLQTLFSHTLIGFDKHVEMIESVTGGLMDINREDFHIRTDSLLSQIALIRTGAGIGATHKKIAEKHPELIQVLTDFSIPPLQLWIVCHRDVKQNIRIRAFMDFIGDKFQ